MKLADAALISAIRTSSASTMSRACNRIFRDFLAFTYHHRISNLVSLGAILVYLQHLKLLGL